MQSPIAEPGAEQIRTKGGKCLDIFSHGLLDGAPLEVFGCDATVNHKQPAVLPVISGFISLREHDSGIEDTGCVYLGLF